MPADESDSHEATGSTWVDSTALEDDCLVVVLLTYPTMFLELADRYSSSPLTLQASPFVLERPHLVASVSAHHHALKEVIPPSALEHVRTLSHNQLVGAMTGADISEMIRNSFRAGAGETDPVRVNQLVDEAFLGVRTLGHQRRLQDCISVSVTDGLRVTATSQFHCAESRQLMRDSTDMAWAQMIRRDFKYCIRMDNIGETAATVLGREWQIYNDDGTLEQEIRKGTPVARAVVGLQPVIKPGASFIYYSQTAVSSPRGIMEGSFQVARGEFADPDAVPEAELDVFDATVAPFQLISPPEGEES